MLDLFKQFEDSMEEEKEIEKEFEELSKLKRNIQESINLRDEALHYAIDSLEEIINDDNSSTTETNEKATKVLDDIDKLLLEEIDNTSDELDKLLEELGM